jgi:hypothetical protein
MSSNADPAIKVRAITLASIYYYFACPCPLLYLVRAITLPSIYHNSYLACPFNHSLVIPPLVHHIYPLFSPGGGCGVGSIVELA